MCKRELEIRNFVPLAYFEVVATAKVAGGQFQMRHAPQDRIVRREIAQEIADAARGYEGALAVRVEDKRQGPPKLHDLPSLQKLCGSRFGWPAGKTLEVAQELYDGQGKKIITYPRAELRYLPQSLISDVPQIVAGLRVGQSFGAIPVPEPPMIRKGASGTFYDKGLEGASHHAVIPNVNTIDKLQEVWPRLSSDEKKLFDVIARAYPNSDKPASVGTMCFPWAIMKPCFFSPPMISARVAGVPMPLASFRRSRSTSSSTKRQAFCIASIRVPSL